MQELLGRDAGAPVRDVGCAHAGEQGIHLHQGGVGHLVDGAQAMVGRHEVLQLAQGEQALGEGIGSAHEWDSGGSQGRAVGLSSAKLLACTGCGHFSSLLGLGMKEAHMD